MSMKTVTRSVLATGMVVMLSGCQYGPPRYAGPGCLIYVYQFANFRGGAIPIAADTTDIATGWQSPVGSAKIFYGTWRLYTDPYYEGFMGDYAAPQEIAQMRPDTKLGSLKCIEPAPSP